MFTAGLRGATSTLATVFDILCLHKFRRAPYGSGRFWNSLKETWCMLLARAGGANCPVVDSFMEAIARDVGLPLSALSEPGAFDPMVRRVLRAPIGPKVEMRRWFTFMDAGPDLDRAWHTMLVALIVEFWLEGADPWEVAAKAAARRTDARGDPSENCSYRTEA